MDKELVELPEESEELPKRYYRRIMLDYGYLAKLLNLPEGYRVSHMMEAVEYHGYNIFVECPEEDRFTIEPGDQVQITMSMITTLPNGRVIMWYPEFGMEYPTEDTQITTEGDGGSGGATNG